MGVEVVVSRHERIIGLLLVTEIGVSSLLDLIGGAVPVAVGAVGVGEELVLFSLRLNIFPASA